MGGFSGKINKLDGHGVVVGLWGYLNALTFSTLAAHLGGGMNSGVVTLLSEAQHRRQGKGIKAGSVMVWAYQSGQVSSSHNVDGPSVGDDRAHLVVSARQASAGEYNPALAELLAELTGGGLLLELAHQPIQLAQLPYQLDDAVHGMLAALA